MIVPPRPPVFLSGLIAALPVVLILSLRPPSASGEADGPDWFRVVDVAADDVLNMRGRPSAHAEKVGSIPPGSDCVRNLGCQGGLTLEEFTTLTPDEQAARLKEIPRWCRVEYEGTTGWVAGRYLSEGDCDR
jgi:hypothetical protein